MPSATIDGNVIWYEEAGPSRGDGEPVVLLHGGLVGGESWSAQLPDLRTRFHVFVPDRRGHGRTPDVDGPYTYELMARETISFVDQVVGRPTHLVGWSDGGIVALEVARRRPDLVTKVVVIGANFHRDGLHPAFLATLDDDPQSPALAPMRASYEAESPDGAEHWPVVVDKVISLWRTEPAMTAADLGTVSSPVLVMVGDDDCIDHKHTIALFEALPQGQLAVIPGASHEVPAEKPALVNALIVDFLLDGEPKRTAPVRFGRPDGDGEPAELENSAQLETSTRLPRASSARSTSSKVL